MRTPPPEPLLTVWGESLDPDNPLPEYPRPQLRRDSYLNLNGRWEYAFRIGTEEPSTYDGTIVVPFSPESPLSGVQRQLRPGEKLHYHRTFTLPEGFVDERVILHFGAVDQWCAVRVNGRAAGDHEGGYLPFSLDITDLLTNGANQLHVLVTDPSDTGTGARGKQKLQSGGIWYTAQSGIWQTVWLESVPGRHITNLRLEPDLDHVSVTVGMSDGSAAPCVIDVLADGRQVAGTQAVAGRPARIGIPGPRLWSPEDPYLYDLHITAGEDRVRSYTGLRRFDIGPDSSGLPRLRLNGQPHFHAGVLDQGYWPDGLYTAPSDEALVFDIRSMKDLGFTMLRKHIKIEPLRWYYHCDRLGMLVWQDMVNGGGPYRRRLVEAPALGVLGRIDDRHHRLFGRADRRARQQWLREMEATIDLLRNCVGLAAWVPFNEGWGQFDAAEIARRVSELDPTRHVDHASGWHDQGAGDLTSLHVYVRPFRVPRPRRSTAHRVLALTEYGGYSLHIPDHSLGPQDFGYRRFPTADRLGAAFARLHAKEIVPAVPQGLAATVYTQLSDVEDETNGLLTYDRKVLKIPPNTVRAATNGLRLAPES